MSRYVVDASVVAKWYVPEVHSEAALRFLDDENELLAPDLLFAEMGNILWKKVRAGEMTRNEGVEIVRAVKAAPLDVYPGASLLELAFEVASGAGRSVYDSLYVALAILNECQMVTADRKLHNALANGPFRDRLLWVEAGPELPLGAGR